MIFYDSMRSLLIAASLANLCMLPTWSYLVFNTNNLFYYQHFPKNAYIACFINLISLTSVFFIGHIVSRRFPKIKPLTLIAFLIMVAFAINGIRVAVGINLATIISTIFSSKITTALIGTFALILFWLFIKYHKLVVTVSKQTVLLLSPALLITTGNACFNIFHYKDEFNEVTNSPILTSRKDFRVMLIIFDGLDYRITFEQRPASIVLSSLDELKQTSVFFTQAYPPGHHTKISIPSIFTGQVVLDSKPSGLSDLSLQFDNKKIVLLSETDHLFKEINNRNVRTGIAGWYLPYGRLFGKWVAECTWYPMPEPIMIDQIVPSWLSQLHLQFLPFLPFAAHQLFGLQIPVNDGILEASCSYASNDQLGMVYIHFMKPHFPHVYDIHENRPSASAINSREGYLGDLILVDLAMQKIKETLMQSNLWDKTLLIVTSDHPWMQSKNYDGKFDPRVPLLIKMPNQSEHVTCNTTWNTTLIHKFILDSLDDKIKNSDDCILWIKKNANHLKQVSKNNNDTTID